MEDNIASITLVIKGHLTSIIITLIIKGHVTSIIITLVIKGHLSRIIITVITKGNLTSIIITLIIKGHLTSIIIWPGRRGVAQWLESWNFNPKTLVSILWRGRVQEVSLSLRVSSTLVQPCLCLTPLRA